MSLSWLDLEDGDPSYPSDPGGALWQMQQIYRVVWRTGLGVCTSVSLYVLVLRKRHQPMLTVACEGSTPKVAESHTARSWGCVLFQGEGVKGGIR